MSQSDHVLYETPAPHIARLVLNRPQTRNAQDTHLLYALNDAFDRAARDNDIKAIILAALGPHFSSGHDLRETGAKANIKEHTPVGTWCGFECVGAEAQMSREKEIYIGFSERWRNIPKPTIAEVHGKVIAGGLMLMWPCDIIIAAEDAAFQDSTVAMGVNGVEFFAHPWEMSVRKAKEMLFTSDWITAVEAHRLGMVNHVVPNHQLSAFTLELAKKIATKPAFALKLSKESINAAQDAQGRVGAMTTAFAIHQLAHSHNMQVHGMPVDPSGIPEAVKRR